jgi:hypothetical protein
MALVREHSGYGGFDGAEAAAFAFDALGYGHDAMLGFDAASLFGAGGGVSYAAAGAGCVAAEGGNIVWPTGARASSSVLAFDRATVAVSGEEDEDEGECDAWIDDDTDQSYGDAAAPEARHARASTVSVGYDAATGCFTLTERAASSGGTGRAFGLLFPSTAAAATASLERAAPARASQKRTYVVGAARTQVRTSPAGRLGLSCIEFLTDCARVYAGCGAAGHREPQEEALRRGQEGHQQGQVSAHDPYQGPPEPRGQGR